MLSFIFRHAGKHVVHGQTKPGGRLDFRFGFSLLKDRRIPMSSKIVALGLGVALTTTLIALEVPLEALLGVFVPFLGLATDAIIDGLEVIILPLFFAGLLVPYLVPKSLLETITPRR